MCISKILRGILLIQQEIYDSFDIYLCHTSVNIAACSLQRQNTYLPIYFVLRTRTKGVFTCSIPTSIVTINTRKYCACTCRWTHFSSIGSILVSITTILTSIVAILTSIQHVNTPLPLCLCLRLITIYLLPLKKAFYHEKPAFLQVCT